MSGFDAVSLEIYAARLAGYVDEAAAAFKRVSFSPLVREANDFAVVLTDGEGRLLSQYTSSIPSFTGTMPFTVRHLLSRFGHDLAQGDFIITNDPWIGTGHLNDVCGVMPISHKERLVAVAGVVSHVPDIGGRLFTISSQELFEEGLQIPPAKLLRRGEPDGTLVALIEQNVRTPRQTLGDLWGQASVCSMLGERIVEFLDRSSLSLEELGAELRNRTERAMRAAIRRLPSGTLSGALRWDGLDPPVTLACRVDIAGDSVSVDYAGTSPQLRKGINVVPNYTFAYTAYALKALIEPDIPNNEGSFGPISISAPEGSVLNPRWPAPCSGRARLGHLIVPLIMQTLSPILPGRVWAEGTTNSTVAMSGTWRDRPFALVTFVNGGQGATARRPGFSGLSFPSNLGNTPVEVLERTAPVLVRHRRLRAGSGGAGSFEGGEGLSLAFEYRGAEPAQISFMQSHRREGPQGLAGGGPGAPARIEVDGQPVELTDQVTLARGATVLVETAGGGGFGPADAA